MTSAELNALLTAADFNCGDIQFSDRAYVCPMKDWVLGEFAEAFRRQRQVFKVDNYEPESNDCDDFARDAVTFAEKLHVRTGEHRDAALAIGLLHYTRDAGGAHAVNLWAVDNNGTREIIVVEPQTGQEIKLSESERICDLIQF